MKREFIFLLVVVIDTLVLSYIIAVIAKLNLIVDILFILVFVFVFGGMLKLFDFWKSIYYYK
jgi:hypothetical protein